MKLNGKVALVTGASSGIGYASALALAKEGADLALNFNSYPESAKDLADKITSLGRNVIQFPVDVSDQNAVNLMTNEVVSELGHLDILVTCAAYSDREPFYEADMDGFKKTIDVTMWGAFYAMRAATNQMIKQGGGGNIVIVSSPHAVLAYPNCMAYNMAKAAIDMMAKSAAVELLQQKIRVNLVHPGWTDTPGERKFLSEEVIQEAAKTMPWQRLAKPEEIARGILFLVDPESDYVTGSTLAIDGGVQLPWWSKRSGEGY